MSSLLTSSFIQDEIRDQFGYDVMEFEATNDIVTRSINRCIRTLNVYKPKISRYSLTDVTTADDTAVYVDFGTGVLGIRRVEFTSTTSAYASEDPFRLYESALKGGAGSEMGKISLESYINLKNRSKMVNKLFGVDDDYQWIEEEKRLILHVPTGPKNVYIEYFEQWTAPTQIPADDDQLFLDMVTAQVKMKVGMMRRKYGGSLPSPGGVSIQLDGSDLVQEGRESWERLLERLSLIKHELGIFIA